MSANVSPIQILRSYANTEPTYLLDGQPAYSFVNQTLYIGNTTGAAIVIGGNSVVGTALAAYNEANAAASFANAAFAGDAHADRNTVLGALFGLFVGYLWLKGHNQAGSVSARYQPVILEIVDKK